MASLKRSLIPLASLLQCFRDYVFLLRYFVQHQTLYSRRNLTFDLTSATPRPFFLQPGPDSACRSLTSVIVYHVRLGQGMALAGLAAYGSSSEEEEDEEDEVKAKKTAGDQDSDDDEEEEETQKEPPKAVPAQVMCLDEAPTSRARRPNVVIYT